MKIVHSFFIIILFIACKMDTDASVKVAPSHQKSQKRDASHQDLNQTTSISKAIFSDQQYASVYDAYLNVKAALVNTDVSVAQKKGIILKKSLEAITVSEEMKLAVKEIVSENETKKQRIAFDIISKELEIVFSRELTSGTIYKQYCPMAFNGEGAYWLSDSKEVRNPYFGYQMLKCGVVDSKIE